METFEAIRTLLAVRSYRDEPVPSEVVHRIVEAGRLTGSSMNLQPWHFVVIQERATLSDLGRLAQSGPYTAEAAFAVAVATEKSSPYGVSDGSRAIQSMMLAGWEEGVGSNWVGFANLDAIAERLGIPEQMRVLGLIPFGYPTAKIGKGHKNRKALKDVAHGERWGNPFA